MKKRAQTICALCWGCRFLPKREGGFLHIYCAVFGGRKHHLFPTFVVFLFSSALLLLWLSLLWDLPFYYLYAMALSLLLWDFAPLFLCFCVCFCLFLVSTVTLSFCFYILDRFFYVLYVLVYVLCRFFMFFRCLCFDFFVFSCLYSDVFLFSV